MNHNLSSTHWKCSKSPQVWESLGGGNGAPYARWQHGVAHQRGGGRRRVVYPVLRISYFVFLSQKEKKNTDVRSFKAWFWFTEWEKITMPAHYSILRQFQGPMLGTPYCRPPSPPHVWIPLKSIFSMLGIFLVNDSQTPLPSKTTIWDFCRFVFYTFENVKKSHFRH